MMEPSELEKANPTPDPKTAPGEKWKHQAAMLLRGRTLNPCWQRLVFNIFERYKTPSLCETLQSKRVRAETLQVDSSAIQPKPYPLTIAGFPEMEAAPAEYDLTPEIERSSRYSLDADLKQLIKQILDIRIPTVKIYANLAADRLARQHDADAVTYSDKIFFKAGKFKPKDPAGVALLGHELTHAAQARMETQRLPGQPATRRLEAQESDALVNEATVLHHILDARYHARFGHQSRMARNDSPAPTIRPFLAAQTPVTVDRGLKNHLPKERQLPTQRPAKATVSPIPQPSQRPKSSPALSQKPVQHPKTAATSRQISMRSEAPIDLGGLPTLSEQQLNQIKESVYRDLMDRIRIEFERGG